MAQVKELRYICLPENTIQSPYNIMYDIHFFDANTRDSVTSILVTEKKYHDELQLIFYLAKNYTIQPSKSIAKSKILSIQNLRDSLYLYRQLIFSKYKYQFIFNSNSNYFIHDTKVHGYIYADR
jgi:hypothetical protein